MRGSPQGGSRHETSSTLADRVVNAVAHQRYILLTSAQTLVKITALDTVIGIMDSDRDLAERPAHPRLEMAGIIVRSVVIAIAITGGVWLAVDFALNHFLNLPP
jgi:hypothetical protein